MLPEFVFDGRLLFTTSSLTSDGSAQDEQTKKDTRISIKLVGKIQPTDYHYVQFFNIVLRAAMEKLQMELINRDYFDLKAAVPFTHNSSTHNHGCQRFI